MSESRIMLLIGLAAIAAGFVWVVVRGLNPIH